MPLATWQEDILKHGELYCVGGAVRDRLIGLESTTPDADYLVRKIPPEELERILSVHGRVQLVGKSFGVYKFTPHEAGDAKGTKKAGKNGKSTDSHATQAIDIAYPRKEASTGPGHRDFRVEFDWTLPIDADLGRRDFTINAIAQNMIDGSIVDPLGGAEDLKNKLLRMVFPSAFEEDALRILRGARFTARFDLEVEAATRRAMKSGVPHLKLLSPERIQEEFTKLLTQCTKPSTGFELLHTVGALAVVFPELDRCAGVTQNEYHPDDVFVHSLKSCDCAPRDNLEVRWAALMHDLGKVDKKKSIEADGEERIVFYGHDDESSAIAGRVLKRLRYSNDLIGAVKHLIAHHMFDYTPEWSDAGVRRFMRRVGEDNLQNLFLLREADCCSRNLTGRFADVGDLKNRIDEERKKENAFKITDLAISGRDLMKEFNIKEGKIIGRVLNELLDTVLDDPSLNKKDQLLELAKKILKIDEPL
jgi:poly(A) polymerase/tRNA nucleotidyltransferase (CCA-adding enzyme)